MAEKMANTVEERDGQRMQKVDNEDIDKEEVNKEEIDKEEEFINKHLRLSEELQRHSSNAQMILLTLPQQYIGQTNRQGAILH